jgi:nucleotide-binding universal stress UspA family protein
MKLERVVVGVDGSANGRTALEWAAELAVLAGAEVVAVHALGLLERLDDGPPVPAQHHRVEITRRFEELWCEPLASAGVRSRRLVRDGDPVSVLLAVAEEERADLLVVGSRGVGDHPEQLLGSTSTQVAQRARQPVVVVPPA